MTAMGTPISAGLLRGAVRACLAIALVCTAMAAGGCATSHPPPISARELAEAQTFPYYRVYWVGPSFDGHPLAAADGQKGYLSAIGDSVYYGDCIHGKGAFGGGGCPLALQVTTVIYREHSNATLGPQSNIVVRGVPATVYDQGHSIEIYSGHAAIDVFSDSFALALEAANELRPINAPGAAKGHLPPPVYCPVLAGVVSAEVMRVMETLPRQACQRASAALALGKSLFGSS
jgi:hypothetical protein